MDLKYITLASAFNFLLLGIVLLFKKAPNKKANNIMGFLFLVIALYSYFVSFRYTSLDKGDYSALNHYIPIDGILLLLMAPCLYYYTLTILNKQINYRDWKMLFHFIPIVPFIIYIIYFFSLPLHLRIDWFIRDFTVGTLENNLLNIVLYVQIPLYLFFSYYVIKKQLKVSDKVTINNVQLDVSWLKTYLLMNICYMIITAPLCFYFANERANIIIGEIGMNIQFVFIFFKSAFQKNVFSAESIQGSKSVEPTLKIDDAVVEKHLLSLHTIMTNEKPYLNEDCSIQIISEKTGISIHQLSFVLNNRLKKGFSDYINESLLTDKNKISPELFFNCL